MNFPVYSVLTIMSLVSVALLRDHEDPEDIAHRGCPRGVPVKRIEIKGPCDEPGCDAFVDNKKYYLQCQQCNNTSDTIPIPTKKYCLDHIKK
ncbi:hypothetical protein PCANC_09057 [Puccinia coronata f. sp. avenae]|uniref:Secreted protein n=1 Tax=Puccinia coronata f. sp. avenae TaxID=200324 RepID=A0A2N5T211_9BASI|nr:hypothetical protein PCANC_09057 [Puccinia coronata f. sp. avenae]